MTAAEEALRTGDLARCLSIVLTLLEQDQVHVGALELLAKTQWQLGLNQPLLDTLSKLVKINPYEPGYHTLRGAALCNLNRYGEAFRAYVRAGDDETAVHAMGEINALQMEILTHLLHEDRVFKAEYSQSPERACNSRGLEFGSERKIRNHVLFHDYAARVVLQRPS